MESLPEQVASGLTKNATDAVLQKETVPEGGQ